uniref:Uncharacterized protein n=1 Tax=Micrurus lemniscatus lemniscatus TaxID=129467 RepID=A0A2D4IG77_MICLE
MAQWGGALETGLELGPCSWFLLISGWRQASRRSPGSPFHWLLTTLAVTRTIAVWIGELFHFRGHLLVLIPRCPTPAPSDPWGGICRYRLPRKGNGAGDGGGCCALGLNSALLPAGPPDVLRTGALQGRVTGIRAVGVFAEAAGPGAEDLTLLGQERLPEQGLLATRAAETGISGVPVLALIGHLALVNTNVLPACIAIFCIEALITTAAIGATLAHDVSLPTQGLLTFKAAEMAHVPVTALGFCALICKDDLITSFTSRLEALSMVAPTVDFALLVEVDQVNEELPTRGTNKALGVPAGTMPSSTGKDSNVPSANLFSTLFTDGSSYGDRKESDRSSAKVLSLTLL